MGANSKSFQPGNKKGGRKKGTPNKITRTVKETVLNVFNDLQSDPRVNLAAFAKKYPRDFYTIASKLIPTEMAGSVETTITFKRDGKSYRPDAKSTSPGTGENTP